MASLQTWDQPSETLPPLLAGHLPEAMHAREFQNPWGGLGFSMSPHPEGPPMPNFLSAQSRVQGPFDSSFSWYTNNASSAHLDSAQSADSVFANMFGEASPQSYASSSSPVAHSGAPRASRSFQRAPGSGAHRGPRSNASRGGGASGREPRHGARRPASWLEEPSSGEKSVQLWSEGAAGPVGPADLLGSWADSLGNAVLVSSTDAYRLKLVATLSQPPRKDIHLTIRPVPDGGWNCGNAMLDPVWSSTTQLHWFTPDGRVSVWVRLPSS